MLIFWHIYSKEFGIAIIMMIQKIKIAVLFFLVLGVHLRAQERWTLEECISHALEHNLQLKDMDYAKDSGKETYRQSIRNLLPTVGASSNYVISYGRSTDPFTNDIVNSDFFNNNYSLNASISVFEGFQKINSIKASKFLYKAAKEDVQQEKFLLAFKVMSAYYDIRFYEGLLKNSYEQETISQNNYDLVKKQIELGIKAGSDLYDADATLLGDKLLVTQNTNFLAAAKLALLQAMNLEGVTDITLQEDFELAVKSQEEVQVDSVFNKAKEFIPMLKAQQLRAKAAKKQLAAARGRLFPLVSIFSGYNTGYYETTVDSLGVIIPFKNQIRDNASHYIGASIEIPISYRWSRRSAVKQQKISMLRERNNVEIQEQELFKIIQELVQQHNALEAEMNQSTEKVKLQELAFEIAQKKYEKGLISALELFQAKNLFGAAQNENLQKRMQYRVNEKTLDFYGGLPVFNIN